MKKILLSSAMLIAITSGANAQLQRNGLVEEFSSSTCPPCKVFNAKYDPVLQELMANEPASRYVAVRYQMNWPAPGTDASYNAHGSARKSYYGVNSVPMHFINGEKSPLHSGSTAAAMKAELQASNTAPTNLDITGTYMVKGDSIFMNVTVTSNADLTGGYKIYVAATETHYENPANTTGQLDYYHVMRKMYPGASGTVIASFTSGTPQSFTFKDKFQVGSVTQNSYKFWDNPYKGHLVVFVQKTSDTSILQAVSIPASWSTGINDVANIGKLNLYPNPTSSQVSVDFTLANPAALETVIFNEVGSVVYRQAAETFTSGNQHVVVPVGSLPAGNYYLKMQSANESMVERFTIIK